LAAGQTARRSVSLTAKYSLTQKGKKAGQNRHRTQRAYVHLLFMTVGKTTPARCWYRRAHFTGTSCFCKKEGAPPSPVTTGKPGIVLTPFSIYCCLAKRPLYMGGLFVYIYAVKYKPHKAL
jgi:hypothetical protein